MISGPEDTTPPDSLLRGDSARPVAELVAEVVQELGISHKRHRIARELKLQTNLHPVLHIGAHMLQHMDPSKKGYLLEEQLDDERNGFPGLLVTVLTMEFAKRRRDAQSMGITANQEDEYEAITRILRRDASLLQLRGPRAARAVQRLSAMYDQHDAPAPSFCRGWKDMVGTGLAVLLLDPLREYSELEIMHAYALGLARAEFAYNRTDLPEQAKRPLLGIVDYFRAALIEPGMKSAEAARVLHDDLARALLKPSSGSYAHTPQTLKTQA